MFKTKLMCFMCLLLFFFPHFPAGLDSNDVLFCGDPNFISEVNSMASAILGQIVGQINSNLAEFPAKRANLAWQLFQTLVAYADLDGGGTNSAQNWPNPDQSLPNLALELWNISQTSPPMKENCQKFLKTLTDDTKNASLFGKLKMLDL